MYEKHFNLTTQPFSIAPDPAFLYLSSAHREALAHLMYGFSHGGFVLITGEVGTGKTTLLRNLLKTTPPDLDVAFILNPRLTVRELLATLCDELGIPYDPSSTTTVKQYIDLITRHLLETHRQGRSTVMIIDEAQNLSPAVLEQVRLLTNLETDDKKLLRIILIGQPELTALLERQELRQLAQRITARYHLGSLSRPDTYAYVMHRMSRAGGNPHSFSQGALRRLYSISRGTPRVINIVADRALLGAYTEGRRQVTGRIVNRAAREVLGHQPGGKKWWLGAALAVGAAGAAWAILGPPGLLERPAATEPPAVAAPAGRIDRPAEAPATPVLEQPAPTVAERPVPEPEAPRPAIERTETGDALITPDSYARMQAERRAAASPRPPPGPTLSPATADATPVPTGTKVEEVVRPPVSAFASRRLAYQAIFGRWGVNFDAAESDLIACDFAPSAGLQCLAERGDWAELERLDLPVVLELWDGSATPFYAALLSLHQGNVTLDVAGQVIQTTQRALRDRWSGAYVVLWQTPPGYYGSIRSGQTHETVGWLRQQLSGFVEQSLASPNPNHFDESLENAVLEFQATEGLVTDGIVGPATWIRLAERLGLPQPSLAG
jgi:general secretion pathway protein A